MYMESVGALFQPPRIVLTTISKIFQGFSWFCRFLRCLWRISPSLLLFLSLSFYDSLCVYQSCGVHAARAQKNLKMVSFFSFFLCLNRKRNHKNSVKQWIEKVLIFFSSPKDTAIQIAYIWFGFVGKIFIQNGTNSLYIFMEFRLLVIIYKYILFFNPKKQIPPVLKAIRVWYIILRACFV